jgi:hypothetical protein
MKLRYGPSASVEAEIETALIQSIFCSLVGNAQTYSDNT